MEEGLLVAAAITGLIELGIAIEYGWTGAFVGICSAILAELFLQRFDLGGFLIFVTVGGAFMAAALYVIFKIVLGLVGWRMSVKKLSAESAKALDDFEQTIEADPARASARIKSALNGATSPADLRDVSLLVTEFKRRRPEKYRKARAAGIL